MQDVAGAISFDLVPAIAYFLPTPLGTITQPKPSTMKEFNIEHFTRRLITESLFYDEEYGALGNLSLIDPAAGQERYVASYLPEEGLFAIEEATEWEDLDPGEDDEIGYALAVDSEEYGTYETPEEAAEVLLQLARDQDLLPSITLLFEEDEVV